MLTTQEFSGSADINHEGIKKHFKNYEPWKAIFELVWNGLDANADLVEISIRENEMFGIESVTILDNGTGIDFFNSKNNFGKFNDSSKKDDADQHGSHGRGRLSFHRLCADCTWYTKFNGNNAKISVNQNTIKNYFGKSIDLKLQHALLNNKKHGTCVELTNIHKNLPELELLKEKLSQEFGWYLALNKDKVIKINNENILIPSHEIKEEEIQIENVIFNAKIIRWDCKPSSEKSYTYLLNNNSQVKYKVHSSFNNKVNFFTSIYVYSSWNDDFHNGDDDMFSPSNNNPESPIWKSFIRKLAIATQEVYNEFLRRFVDIEIEKYIVDGIFPEYKSHDHEYDKWRLENTKSIVRTIYFTDPSLFSSLKNKQKKIIVRLLDKLSISSENDSLFEVLNSILDLDKDSLDTLAGQLQRTKLENIISTIEVLQKRQDTISQLRILMNEHYNEVLETPDLQKIIESNTWLFGSNYETIGAEEDTFTKIAQSLRDKIKYINSIENDELAENTTLEGANRQTDLFLARKIPTHNSLGDQIFRCIVIEIKRPCISLNKKHLRQLDDYAEIIQKHPEFGSENMHFELILIGRKISAQDTEIKSRLKNQLARSEMGLVAEDDRMKRYVKNWYTILDSFELSNDFMIKKLQLQRIQLTDTSKNELVEGLQAVE